MNSISDVQLAVEDDQMLNMQIQLGEAQERTLKRKIEAKRRKANTPSVSANSFNLTRELSFEIDKDRAQQFPNLAARNKELENEVNLMKAQTASIHQHALEQARQHVSVQMNKYQEELRAEFAQEMTLRLQNASSSSDAIMDKYKKELRAELDMNRDTHLHTVVAEAKNETQVELYSRQEAHDRKIAEIRDQCSSAMKKTDKN